MLGKCNRKGARKGPTMDVLEFCDDDYLASFLYLTANTISFNSILRTKPLSSKQYLSWSIRVKYIPLTFWKKSYIIFWLLWRHQENENF